MTLDQKLAVLVEECPAHRGIDSHRSCSHIHVYAFATGERGIIQCLPAESVQKASLLYPIVHSVAQRLYDQELV